VDDDNQLLAYGSLPAQRFRLGARMARLNLELVEKVRQDNGPFGHENPL
jgi:hypothetical protein